MCPPGYLLWQWQCWVFKCSYIIRANALEIYIVAGLFNNEQDPDVVRQRDMFESILVKYLLHNYKNLPKKNEMKNVKMITDQLEKLSTMVK